MSALHQKVARGFRNLWNSAEDVDDYEPEEDADEAEASADYEPLTSSSTSHGEKYQKFTSTPAKMTPISHGGGTGGHLRKVGPVSNHLRSSREKNIYTLKPKSMDEVSLAADYLKTGCAVVLNLDDVEWLTAVRVIDFMSGVCYGLDVMGHTMKLGDSIFMFTPGDFEISSDETDYCENRDFIFRDVAATPIPPAPPEPIAPMAPSSYQTSQPRSWER